MRIRIWPGVRLFVALQKPGDHDYLSTGCLHGEHAYCQSMTGQAGAKRPGRCKFCDARCVCSCHKGAVA